MNTWGPFLAIVLAIVLCMVFAFLEIRGPRR